MQTRLYPIFCFGLLWLFLAGCRFEQLENKKEINDEIERNTVKRFTPEQIEAQAIRIGDSITHLADSLLQARLATHLVAGDVANALQVYPPEGYPEVKALAQKYKITPNRLRHRNATPTKTQAQVLNQTELLYTRPIYLNDAACLHCHGTEVTDQAKALLQKHKPGSNMMGFNKGDNFGMWQFPIQRSVILEGLTLKKGKSQRIRHLFTKQK